MANNQPHKGLLIIAGPKGGPDAPPDLGPPGMDAMEPDADDQASTGQECQNCKFFKTGAMGGECLRYPPQGTDWAMVQPSDWCGEWQGGPQHISGAEAPAPETPGTDLGAMAPGAR